jgi:YQGE family putative transporter
MLTLAALKGVAQGAIVTAPIMLIMKLLGQEGVLGTLQAIAAVLSATVLYLIGRFTKPRHRIYIFSIGLCVFATGFIINSALFSGLGVIFVMLCITIARPLLDVGYFPIQLGVIDFLGAKENRNKFAYIFNHEFGLYLGRFFGCGLFILLAFKVSENFALKYALLAIGLIQLLSIWIAKIILKEDLSIPGKENEKESEKEEISMNEKVFS